MHLIKVLTVSEWMASFNVHKDSCILSFLLLVREALTRLPFSWSFFLVFRHEHIAKLFSFLSSYNILEIFKKPSGHVRTNKAIIVQSKMPPSILHTNTTFLKRRLNGFCQSRNVEVCLPEGFCS